MSIILYTLVNLQFVKSQTYTLLKFATIYIHPLSLSSFVGGSNGMGGVGSYQQSMSKQASTFLVTNVVCWVSVFIKERKGKVRSKRVEPTFSSLISSPFMVTGFSIAVRHIIWSKWFCITSLSKKRKSEGISLRLSIQIKSATVPMTFFFTRNLQQRLSMLSLPNHQLPQWQSQKYSVYIMIWCRRYSMIFAYTEQAKQVYKEVVEL